MFGHAKQPRRDSDHTVPSARLAHALLESRGQCVFLIDAKGKLVPPLPPSVPALFKRQDLGQLTLERLLAPLITAKALTHLRGELAALLGSEPHQPAGPPSRLSDLEIRLPHAGSAHTAQYRFEFESVIIPGEARSWLVRAADVTDHVQTVRDLEELRARVRAQGDILKSVLRKGRTSFAALLRKTDRSMNTLATVLKKPAREPAAFRAKLAAIFEEVDALRREAAAFDLSALEHTAQAFLDALKELKARDTLSGGDFLPLAVKMDQLYDQVALIKSLMLAASPPRDPAPPPTRRTPDAAPAPSPGPAPAPSGAPASSLDSALLAMTEAVAYEHAKQVVLLARGLDAVPPRHQGAVKNVAVQLIRNAIMHGIEAPELRASLGKPSHGTLRLDFKRLADRVELKFQDDGCGLVPARVRDIAVARGVVTAAAAAAMRDRDIIKLIFKSHFTTLADTAHGSGLSLVRRHVHESGGRIALASIPGRETRFKITLPTRRSLRVE